MKGRKINGFLRGENFTSRSGVMGPCLQLQEAHLVEISLWELFVFAKSDLRDAAASSLNFQMVSERVFFFDVRDVAFRSRNLQEKTARQIKGVVCTSGNCQIASDFVRVSTVRRREKSSVRQRNWPERSDVIGWSLGFGCVLRTEISRISLIYFFLRILKNLNSLAMLRIPPKKIPGIQTLGLFTPALECPMSVGVGG